VHYRTHAVDPQTVTARAAVGGEVYTVPFDHLVVACGSSYPGAIRPGPREWQAESRAEGLRGEAQRLVTDLGSACVRLGILDVEGRSISAIFVLFRVSRELQ
jgi:hypothetical protein